jgi:hypothetical protein
VRARLPSLARSERGTYGSEDVAALALPLEVLEKLHIRNAGRVIGVN